MCLLVCRLRAPRLVWRQVVRGGRMQTVSIFTLVVGDVVPLAIGDQDTAGIPRNPSCIPTQLQYYSVHLIPRRRTELSFPNPVLFGVPNVPFPFILLVSLQVPADGLVLSSHSLTIDESSMTGESDPVRTVLYCSERCCSALQ